MKNIIIMYHYVRDNSNFKCFTFKQFEEQLVSIKKNYQSISLNTLLSRKTDNTFIVTFDDGLKDGVNCLPILRKLKIKAVFFVPTSIFTWCKILSVQKRHLIISKIGIKRFAKLFLKKTDSIYKIDNKPMHGINYIYKEKPNSEDMFTTNFKYILDFMDAEESNLILRDIFDKLFDEEEEFEKIYLSLEDIKKIKSEGHEFGSHGHNHLWLGNLYTRDQIKEIEINRSIHRDIFKEYPLYISYPFGSYNFLTLRILEQAGYKAGLTTIPEYNTSLKSPLELNRFDCIKAK